MTLLTGSTSCQNSLQIRFRSCDSLTSISIWQFSSTVWLLNLKWRFVDTSWKMENNLKVISFTQPGAFPPNYKQRNNSSFAKVGEFSFPKLRLNMYVSWICELILDRFLHHKLFCYNLPSSLPKYWLPIWTQSILMQSSSVSAKIAILSLIWRSKHQRWCY